MSAMGRAVGRSMAPMTSRYHPITAGLFTALRPQGIHRHSLNDNGAQVEGSRATGFAEPLIGFVDRKIFTIEGLR